MVEAIGIFFIIIISCILVMATNYECKNYNKIHEFGRFKKHVRKAKKKFA